MNNVFHFSSPNSEIYLYADDTAAIISADNDHELKYCVNDFLAKYNIWRNLNCIVVNLVTPNFLSFNINDFTVSINGHKTANINVAKYLGLLIDNKLSWSYHVILMLLNIVAKELKSSNNLCLMCNYVFALYYNAFIISCFSYFLMFWIKNERSGR